MITLNLKAESPEMEALKQFLEENANEFLAEKINNGVRIQKDGKTLINKKTLDTFMDYAHDEARKLASKNARYACIKHDVVFSWAMHYFEEPDIIGKLYQEDGTEYKPTKSKPISKPTSSTTAPVITTPTKPQPQQFSLFDLVPPQEESKTNIPKIENDATQIIGFLRPTNQPGAFVLESSQDDETDENIEENNTVDDKLDELNIDCETGEILPPEQLEKKKIPLQQCSPLYQKYINVQNQNPHAVIVYKIGDFFEVFGENAVKLSHDFNLTLTGRDCGLPERIPMIGFPYYASDIYLHKISERYDLVVVENNAATPYNVNLENDITVEEENAPTMYEFNKENDDFNEELELQKSFDKDALAILFELFDYSLDIQ